MKVVVSSINLNVESTEVSGNGTLAPIAAPEEAQTPVALQGYFNATIGQCPNINVLGVEISSSNWLQRSRWLHPEHGMAPGNTSPQVISPRICPLSPPTPLMPFAHQLMWLLIN